MKDLCFKKIAINTLNPAICEKATTEECFWTAEGCSCSKFLIKDTCYEDIAIKLNNISLCEKMSNKWHKDSCISTVESRLTTINCCKECIELSEHEPSDISSDSCTKYKDNSTSVDRSLSQECIYYFQFYDSTISLCKRLLKRLERT